MFHRSRAVIAVIVIISTDHLVGYQRSGEQEEPRAPSPPCVPLWGVECPPELRVVIGWYCSECALARESTEISGAMWGLHLYVRINPKSLNQLRFGGDWCWFVLF